jgi:hypothetical protein
MTLDEKLAQLGCLWSTAFVSTGTFDPNTVAEQKRFVTEPGAFTFSMGGSWADIRAEQTVILDDQVVQYRQREIVGTKVQGG